MTFHSFESTMTDACAAALAEGATVTAEERLSALFHAHQRRLYGLARRLSGTRDDALDLVQETFVRAAQSSKSIPRDPREEEAWLVRILVNICRDRWRVASGRRRLTMMYGKASYPRPSSPEAVLVAHSAIWWALSRLPPRQRTAIIFHDLEGMTTRETARVLGIAIVTVRWHLSTGRRAMARLIRREGHNDG